MRYLERFIRDKESSVYVKKPVDKQGRQIVITAEEYKKLRPELPAMRVNFNFKRDVPLRIDRDIAQYLFKKYDFLYAIDIETDEETALSDDLDEMKYNELIQILSRLNNRAVEMGFEKVLMTGKTEVVKTKIRNFRKMGVRLAEDSDEQEEEREEAAEGIEQEEEESYG